MVHYGRSAWCTKYTLREIWPKTFRALPIFAGGLVLIMSGSGVLFRAAGFVEISKEANEIPRLSSGGHIGARIVL